MTLSWQASILWLLAACIGVQAITTPEGVRQIPVSCDILEYIIMGCWLIVAHSYGLIVFQRSVILTRPIAARQTYTMDAYGHVTDRNFHSHILTLICKVDTSSSEKTPSYEQTSKNTTVG